MARRRIALPSAVVFSLLARAQASDKHDITLANRANIERLWTIDGLYERVLAFERHFGAGKIRGEIDHEHGQADEALLALDANPGDPRATEMLLRCENSLLRAIDVAQQFLALPTMKARMALAKAKRKYEPVRRAARGMKEAGTYDRASAHRALTERFASTLGVRPRTVTNILNKAGFLPARKGAQGKHAARQKRVFTHRKNAKKG
jgi:hypothetical protein